MANPGGVTLRLRRLWEPPAEMPVTMDHHGHGGADERMLTALYGPPDLFPGRNPAARRSPAMRASRARTSTTAPWPWRSGWRPTKLPHRVSGRDRRPYPGLAGDNR